MSKILDENQTCEEIKSLRKSVKVQFTITWQLNRVGLLWDQLRQSLSSNVLFNCSDEEEGVFLFNSAWKQKSLKRICSTPRGEIASCLPRGLLFKQRLAIGQISWCTPPAVNHCILLSKLNHYGVRAKAYDWFHSYLSNREQFVCINGYKSDSLSITCGVPQGSVLGPLLFLLYINDLPNTLKLLSFHLFADDTNIYCSRKDLNDLELILNPCSGWVNEI